MSSTSMHCNRPKGRLTIFHTLVVLLILGAFSISARAVDIGDPPISLSKMPEFAKLKEVESIELSYVPSDKQPLDISEEFLPKIKAKKWSNGKYSIEGVGSYSYRMRCVSYEYRVD